MKKMLNCIIIAGLILLSVRTTQALELNLALHGEPVSSGAYLYTPNGWTYEQDSLSIGLELGHQKDGVYNYIEARAVANYCDDPNPKIAITGLAIEAGVECERFLRIKYSSLIYWDKSGDYGYDMLNYVQPAHKIIVDIHIPLLGGKLPCSENM